MHLVQRVGNPSLRALAARGLPLRAWCARACRVQVRVRIGASTAKRLGIDPLIAIAGGPLPAAHSTALPVRLAGAAAQRLKRLLRVVLDVETEAYDLGGALRARARRHIALRH
jgi:hypothetical protein